MPKYFDISRDADPETKYVCICAATLTSAPPVRLSFSYYYTTDINYGNDGDILWDLRGGRYRHQIVKHTERIARKSILQT